MSTELIVSAILLGFVLVLFWWVGIKFRNQQDSIDWVMNRLDELETRNKAHENKLLADSIRLKRENAGLRRKLGIANEDDDVFPSRQAPVLKFNMLGGDYDGEEGDTRL